MEKIKLKRIIYPHNKTTMILLMAGFYIALYFLSSLFHYGQAGYFALTNIDRSVPFLPWTSFIYVMLYPFLIYMYFEVKCFDNLNKALYAFFFLIVISCGIFVVYPVAYPRDFFPLPFTNSIGVNLLRGIRMLDRPVNCFPSLHVSSVYLFTLAFLHESRKKFWVCFLISTLISASTLTTKQHYIVDVIAGVFFAAVIYFLIWKSTDVHSDDIKTEDIKRDNEEFSTLP